MGRYIELSTTQDSDLVVRCSGDWTSANARALELDVAATEPSLAKSTNTVIDIAAIDALDTIGAWLLTRLRRQGAGPSGGFAGASGKHQSLLERIDNYDPEEAPAPTRENWFTAPFDTLGRTIMGGSGDIYAINTTLGHLLSAFGQTMIGRAPLRLASFVQQFEQIILRAIPIVALISLVVGAIITQQTILQLRNFGASILVVDLAAILMFREIGVLLAAIMVAGRSGSAITAEIGSMRIREEFDALRVMGVDPYQALMLPRTLALIVGLPLLAFVGSMAGMAGAILVARVYGDIPVDVFIIRLRDAMTMTSIMAGLIKAPFMGLLIGLLASLEGMKVQGSSESLGRRTTSSVVKAIFVVIVADGLFAVFYAAIGF
ncbi:ABC transporter permease [Devosia sp.]|uniref:MlaE family ABC transporter permease n=1 Tax=Devosia sp. TaxID=1871048 RepID=UPI002733CEA4|nr:ABC transporter permease [Devosia sp.]MDP2780413.1 ABC transporter permease [Devosia sp.]